MRQSEPPFALCGPRGALIADGVQARFCIVPAAEAALRSGAAPILLDALPFDVSAPAALMVPGTVRRTGALPDWPTGPLPPVRIAATVPTREDVLGCGTRSSCTTSPAASLNARWMRSTGPGHRPRRKGLCRGPDSGATWNPCGPPKPWAE